MIKFKVQLSNIHDVISFMRRYQIFIDDYDEEAHTLEFYTTNNVEGYILKHNGRILSKKRMDL